VGSFLAGFTFIYTNEKFLEYFFNKKSKHYEMNWKLKLLVSYLMSDVIKAAVFLPFEARKQRIQMFHNLTDLTVGNMGNFMLRAYFPLVLRDLLFRFISFGSFIKFLNVEHQPVLKYKMPEIQSFIKYKEKMGESVEPHIFVDYSKLVIKSNFNAIFFNLVFCTMFATVVTHPFDVIATKILTQTRLKYRGLIQTYNVVVREEGVKKLFMSGLGVRFSFNMLCSMSVLLLFEKMNIFVKNAYEN
jgi:hypothetical protein